MVLVTLIHVHLQDAWQKTKPISFCVTNATHAFAEVLPSTVILLLKVSTLSGTVTFMKANVQFTTLPPRVFTFLHAPLLL